MKAKKVFEIPKEKETYTSKIGELKRGEDFLTPYSNRGTVCPLISVGIKYKYPKRKFKTSKVTVKDEDLNDVDLLQVKRIK